jgi:hypothetical protein
MATNTNNKRNKVGDDDMMSKYVKMNVNVLKELSKKLDANAETIDLFVMEQLSTNDDISSSAAAALKGVEDLTKKVEQLVKKNHPDDTDSLEQKCIKYLNNLGHASVGTTHGFVHNDKGDVTTGVIMKYDDVRNRYVMAFPGSDTFFDVNVNINDGRIGPSLECPAILTNDQQQTDDPSGVYGIGVRRMMDGVSQNGMIFWYDRSEQKYYSVFMNHLKARSAKGGFEHLEKWMKEYYTWCKDNKIDAEEPHLHPRDECFLYKSYPSPNDVRPTDKINDSASGKNDDEDLSKNNSKTDE